MEVAAGLIKLTPDSKFWYISTMIGFRGFQSDRKIVSPWPQCAAIANLR